MFHSTLFVFALLQGIQAQTSVPWVGVTPPNIVLSYPATAFPFQTGNVEDVPLALKLLSRLTKFDGVTISVTSANYNDTTAALSAASLNDISTVLPFLDIRACLGSSTGVFLNDCRLDGMSRLEEFIKPVDFTLPITMVLSGTIDSSLAVLRDRTLKNCLGSSTIIVASDWAVLQQTDREASIYLSQYITVKYPDVVKFIAPDLQQCASSTKDELFDEDGIIDDILFGEGLDARAAIGVLYTLNPAVLDSWVSDSPFSGAKTAGCFNTYKILETLENLFTPPPRSTVRMVA